MKIVNSIDEVIDIMKSVGKDLKEAQLEATQRYLERELPNRFSSGNTRIYGYVPNTPQYEEIKRKKWGDKPQLVASGQLRNRVITGVRRVRDKIVVTIPNYGKYQRLNGRDFLVIRPEDRKEIMNLTRIIYRRNKRIR